MNEKLFDIFFIIGEVVEGPKLITTRGNLLGRIELKPTSKNSFSHNPTYVGIYDNQKCGTEQIYNSLKDFFLLTGLSENELYLFMEKTYYGKIKKKEQSFPIYQ